MNEYGMTLSHYLHRRSCSTSLRNSLVGRNVPLLRWKKSPPKVLSDITGIRGGKGAIFAAARVCRSASPKGC